MNIIDLNPKKVIEFFSQLCSVPHGSGNTDAISNLVVEFAKQRGLKYIKDWTVTCSIIHRVAMSWSQLEGN